MPSGFVHLALIRGDITDGRSVLVRLHSECLTGDALGSRRCDCGLQLAMSLRTIATEGRGVLLYTTGHEGRGIGLVRKLQAYVLQDEGDDTVTANLHLGLPADGRDYSEAVEVLRALGIGSVRLLTNNPAKERALRTGGLEVASVIPLPVSPHVRNVRYLKTKERRMGHRSPRGVPLPHPDTEGSPSGVAGTAIDATGLLGHVAPPSGRPYVAVKYAQTLDGRIATADGDSKWISGGEERRLSHALRGASDAVMVGIGTVLADDPRLTVRMVAGASPMRVILDSRLRLPPDARVLDDGAWTVVLTTDRSSPGARARLRDRGVAVAVLPPGPQGVDLTAALAWLRQTGVASLLVEGGATVITSMLAADVVDRLIVSVAPTVIGAGRDAVGDLGVVRVSDALHLEDRAVHAVGRDLVFAGTVRKPVAATAEAATR
jgi:GTP cyclohydrolase II